MTLFSHTFETAKTLSCKSVFMALCFASALSVTKLSAETPTPITSSMSESVTTGKLETLYIGKGKTKKTDLNNDIGYQSWSVCLGSLNQTEGTTQTVVDLGIQSSNLAWDNSPYFSKKDRLGFFVRGVHHFQLDLPVELHAAGKFETDLQGRQFDKYSMGFLSLWASKDVNGHNLSLGLYKEAGRYSTAFLPILGVQTMLSEHFNLDVLFPFYAKLSYSVSDPCQVYVGVKSLRDRQKTQPSDSELYSKSIWEYKATLAHLGVSYRYLEMASANLELGRSLGTSVRVYDAEGHKKAYHKIDSTTFARLALNFWF